MEYSQKNKVERLIKEYQSTIFWNDQNIDIYNLLFSTNEDFDLIDY